MKEICNKNDCVGCGACLSACNHKAITMQPDTLGFLYPDINQEQCIDCGLCAKSCLNNHTQSFKEPIYTCVGHALDNYEQLSSTSGGIASVYMRAILQDGGVVYGCSGVDAHEVKHIRIESPSEIEKLKGSKYVQSYMGLTYKTLVSDLRADRIVLFVGTPCQVAGLRTYLRGRSYDNLFTVDFVCHGVPSQQILNDAIDTKVEDCDGVTLVNRAKDNGKESKYTLRLMKGNQMLCDERYPSLGYITGFLCGLYYRENCYQCQFSRRERVSDITLGDFWDKYNDVKGLHNKKAGLSMIMVNTEAGKKLQEKCNDYIEKVEWSYEDFIHRNGQLKQPIKKHPKRAVFEELYKKEGFKVALSETLCQDLKHIKYNETLNVISLLINRTPIIRFIYNTIRNR